jgi:class I fructose-bisphosphate aldolase
MTSDKDILEMVKGSVDAGGAGVSIGRNVFQHATPKRMIMAISKIVHEGETVTEAIKLLDPEVRLQKTA